METVSSINEQYQQMLQEHQDIRNDINTAQLDIANLKLKDTELEGKDSDLEGKIAENTKNITANDKDIEKLQTDLAKRMKNPVDVLMTTTTVASDVIDTSAFNWQLHLIVDEGSEHNNGFMDTKMYIRTQGVIKVKTGKIQEAAARHKIAIITHPDYENFKYGLITSVGIGKRNDGITLAFFEFEAHTDGYHVYVQVYDTNPETLTENNTIAAWIGYAGAGYCTKKIKE